MLEMNRPFAASARASFTARKPAITTGRDQCMSTFHDHDANVDPGS